MSISLMVSMAQTSPKDLNYFLNSAHFTSPLLKDLNNQRRSAKVDSLIIKATSGFQVNVNSAGLYAPVVKGYGFDEVLTNGQALEGYLNLSYNLLNGKRLNNQLEGVKIQIDSIQYASTLSNFDLNRTITDQYLTAYSSQLQNIFNIEVVNLLEKEDGLLKQLTRSNIYKQSEYLTFLVTLQQQQLILRQSNLQFQNDYATLAYLSGIQDTSKAVLIAPNLDGIKMASEQTFFLQKFAIDSLRNANLKRNIDLNYLPKLGVYANGGYNSSFILQPYKNFGASVGFTFSVPIYDGNQRKMQYNKLAIASDTRSIYRSFFIDQQKQQLNLIRQQIAQTDALFSKINDQIRFSKSLIDVDRKLLHTGDLRMADFIMAINNYMTAQNLYRQTTINKLKLINQFNYWNK
ncbi:TolC family protein [Pedobacter changchengzhani]|nr:TolC family protein [Pedobacter changchengzhani]